MHKINPLAQNILIFLPNWVGDVVMATPALRAIRTHFAGARFTLIGRKIALDTLAGADWIEGTILEQSNCKPALAGFASTAMEIRGGKFDLAILLPNSFRTALLAKLAGGIQRVAGYDRDGRGWLLSDKLKPPRDQNEKLAPLPTIEYYNALAVRLGSDDPGWKMELPVSPADDEAAGAMLAGSAADSPLVMLNPGASFGPSKLWPAERFAAVADALIEHDHARIIINAAPAEKPIAAALAAAMKHTPLINFATRDNSLGLLKGLLKRCDLLITNDTGARHIGAAFGAALVTIFGSTNPVWSNLNYDQERIIRVPVSCSPCQSKHCLQPEGKTFHQCMGAIEPPMVLAAAQELLAMRGTRPSGGQP